MLRTILLQTSHLVDWFRNNVGQDAISRVRFGCGGTGASDLLGIRRSDGRFVACEVKRPGGRASAEQFQFLARVGRSNGIAILAYSVDDVLRVLVTVP